MSNAVDINGTTSIAVGATAINGDLDWDNFLISYLKAGSTLTFADSQGRISIFRVTADASPVMAVTAIATQSGNWSGVYQLSISYSSVPTLSQVLAASSITPVADGTVTPVTSITTTTGIPTAIS